MNRVNQEEIFANHTSDKELTPKIDTKLNSTISKTETIKNKTTT